MKILLSIFALAVFALQLYSQTSHIPSDHWMKFKNPEDAGFTLSEIEEIKSRYSTSGSSALMIVYDGAIVLSLGEVSRKHLDQSMRKSYISALFGIFIDKGLIDLNETLASLGIDDISKLTDEEKEATVEDLLTSRSGVYHKSAYSPANMIKNLPPRGSHKHGTFWYYNNWDFNTLAAIFEKKTSINVFEAFRENIAVPLQMEDFDITDTYFKYEPELSNYPAYLFRLSARDEARFGLLYLNNGNWNSKQVIPSSWISSSTAKVTDVDANTPGRGGYGYLWWTDVTGNKEPYFIANGANGQRIVVVPSRKLVIVNSTNSFDPTNVIHDVKIDNLIGLIILSQSGNIKPNAELEPLLTEEKVYPQYTLNEKFMKLYTGDYINKMLGTISIIYESGKWSVKTGIGIFRLHPATDSEFIVEDMEFPVIFTESETTEEKGTASVQFEENKRLKGLMFKF